MSRIGQRQAVGAVAEGVESKIRVALAQLLEARDYARDAGRHLWDFAVEIGSLRAVGLTTSDLRWLVCKGYVEHARELTLPGEQDRSFRPAGKLTFTKRTCFVLTEAGVSLARPFPAASPELPMSLASSSGDGRTEGVVPEWDAELRELRLRGRLIKQYKQPAANQTAILAAFQEEGWPLRIDDPLPPQPEQDPKRRLHDTIKCLNRHQKSRLVHFVGDGTGQGVQWGLLERGSPAVAGRTLGP